MMKTYNKLTTAEKILHSKKVGLNFNFEILLPVFKFIFEKVNDAEVVDKINKLLVTFLNDIDKILNKHLSTHETDNEKDPTCSAN